MVIWRPLAAKGCRKSKAFPLPSCLACAKPKGHQHGPLQPQNATSTRLLTSLFSPSYKASKPAPSRLAGVPVHHRE